MSRLSLEDNRKLVIFHETFLLFSTVMLFGLGIISIPFETTCSSDCDECGWMDQELAGHYVTLSWRIMIVRGVFFGGAYGALLGFQNLGYIQLYENNSIRRTGASVWILVFIANLGFATLGLLFMLFFFIMKTIHYSHLENIQDVPDEVVIVSGIPVDNNEVVPGEQRIQGVPIIAN